MFEETVLRGVVCICLKLTIMEAAGSGLFKNRVWDPADRDLLVGMRST